MLEAAAAVSTTEGGFTLETVQVGPPGPREVSVRMAAAGVCHTDYDSMHWDARVVMGHEGAGIVTALGEGVTACAVGDPVLLNWAMPCGHCFQCESGNESICEVNNPVTAANTSNNAGHAHPEACLLDGRPIRRSFNLGTMSQHTVVCEAAVVKIEVEVPLSSAAIVGCGVMTGYGSAVNTADVQPGSSCVVIGVGGVGLNAVQGCRIAGASSIIAVDVNPQRLEMAKQFGATHTILAARDDTGLLGVAERVKSLTQGRGADCAIECTAVPALGAAPLAMIRNAGTAVQASGIEEDLTIDMNLFEWDKKYINPLYGQCRPRRDFPRLLQLYASGDLLLDELVTRTYLLSELATAFDDMLAGRNAKGVIVLDS